MRRLIAVVFAIGALGQGCWGRSTITVQVSHDGHSIAGALSPDGAKVAFICIEKVFIPGSYRTFDGWTAECGHYYKTKICVWDGKNTRVVTRLPDGRKVADRYNYDGSVLSVDGVGAEAPYYALKWITGGRYLLVDSQIPINPDKWGLHLDQENLLVRLADGQYTRIKKDGDGLHMDKRWDLSGEERRELMHLLALRFPGEVTLRNALAATARKRRWPRGSLDRLIDRSPTKPDQAILLHQDDYYLTIANLRAGSYRRIPTDHRYILCGADWSPDGKTIVYLMQSSLADGPFPFVGFLYAVHPDGSRNHRLRVRDVVDYSWISSSRLSVTTGIDQDGSDGVPTQIRIVDMKTGRAREITGGKSQHKLDDVKGDKYLVVQRTVPPVEKRDEWLTGDVCIVQTKCRK